MLPPKVGYPSLLEVDLLKKVRLFYTDVLCSGSLSFERTNEKKQEMQSCLVRFFLMAEGCPAGQQEVQLTFLCLKGIPALLTQREGSLASPFLFFHIHAFSWHRDQFRSEFSPLLPSELFTACPICLQQKEETLAILWASISPPVPPSAPSASGPPSLGFFPACYRAHVSPLLYCLLFHCHCITLFQNENNIKNSGA